MSETLQQILTVINPIESTTLAENLDDTDTEAVLTDASDFLSSGKILIDGDSISYTGKTGNTLTGVTGIVGGGHVATDVVWQEEQTSGAIPLSGVRKVSIFLTRSNHTAGGSTDMTAQVSGDGTTYIDFNKLIDNATTTPNTRIATKTLSSATTDFVTMAPDGENRHSMKVKTVITANGSNKVKVVLEYF